MKTESLAAFKPAVSRGDGEGATAPDPAEGADAPEFALALQSQSTDESPAQVSPDGDSELEWEGGLRGGGKRLDAGGNHPSLPSASPGSLQAMVWVPEASVLSIALVEQLPPDADGAPNGAELTTSETPGGRRSGAHAARSQTNLTEVRSRLSDEAAASAAGPTFPEVVLPTTETSPPAAPLLAQAAQEPGLNLAVLTRAAHIVVGMEDGRRLELHLRLTGGRTEIRAAGALVHVIRARLAELRLVLLAQGVPLAGFEGTDEEEGVPSDRDDEPAHDGRGQDVSRVFRTKA